MMLFLVFFQDTEVVSLILIWSYCVFYTKHTVLKFFRKNQTPWAAWCVQKAFTQFITVTVMKRLCILQLVWKLVVTLKNASDHGQSQREMFFLLQIFESLCHFLTKYFHCLKKYVVTSPIFVLGIICMWAQGPISFHTRHSLLFSSFPAGPYFWLFALWELEGPFSMDIMFPLSMHPPR